MVVAKVVYMRYGEVTYYPEIHGPYITITPLGKSSATVTVRTKRHGNILRSVYFDEVVTIDRQFSDDHYEAAT